MSILQVFYFTFVFLTFFMENINTKANFRIIQIIYSTLILGVFAFFLYTYSSVKNTCFSFKDGSIFMILVPLSFIIAVVASSFLYKKTIQTIHENNGLYSKLNKYQGAIIMKGAPLEAAGLIAVVGFMMTSNSYYLSIATVVLGLMVVNFPTKNKFSSIVDLSLEEQNRLNDL